MKGKEAKDPTKIVGKNGVVLRKSNYDSEGSGYRTYEVYQRERVGESTEKIKPYYLDKNKLVKIDGIRSIELVSIDIEGHILNTVKQ